MTVVKGSKEYQWKVVKQRPSSQWIVGLSIFAVFAAIAQVLYFVGQESGSHAQKQALTSLDRAEYELTVVRNEKAEIAQELENIRVGSTVDRQSLESVRLEVIELRSTIAALQEDNQFYRNLMAPSGNKRGLSFGTVEIVATERARTYHFKVVMQQLATNHQLLKGSLSFNIIGRKLNEVTLLSLSDVSKDIDGVNIKLRFKYFQNIEGELVLPVGFDPERIELDARSTGKKAASIEKRFAWLVEEK